MAIVTRFLLPKSPKIAVSPHKLVPDEEFEQQPQVMQAPNSLKRFLGPKQDAVANLWVPNISAVIKAGDEGLISCALFSALKGEDGEVSLDDLYRKFASEIYTHPVAERYSYAGDMTKFVARMRKPAGGLNRSKSTSQPMRPETNLKSRRKSMDPSVPEIGRSRSLVVRRLASPLLSMRNGLRDESNHHVAQKSWTREGQKGIHQESKTRITLTRSELVALLIVLGSELSQNVDCKSSSDTGAYNISVAAMQTNGSKYHIKLTQNKRSRSQQHARGSGVSPLFAKHLAVGSLPFSQDNHGIHSILINKDTFNALQSGVSLDTQPSSAPRSQSKLLDSLPNSRELRFYDLVTSAETHTSTTLLDAIAALPFSGGLAPLASRPLIQTVQFIASGDLPPGKLLQRLEGLVDKVHRHSPQLDIFGPLYEPRNGRALYRERVRLSKLASDPPTPDTRADKTARMSRYITLLERLMALVPDMKPHTVLKAVEEATKLEVQRSYNRTVSAHTPRSNPASAASITLRRRSAPQPLRRSMSPPHSPASRSNRSSLLSNNTSPSDASQISSNEDSEQTLAKQLERVLKSELPLDVPTIAFVARMVLVAWTLSVDVVAWGDDEQGDFRIPDLEGWDKIVMS
ncbi:g-protein beta wd-40 repeat-containing protein [Curvularia clavata]|uniref:G-protein beta wd-40 repeat-containing protein n=1 Tax=Curvularia clavata TaxID=95742 RepID=A0A9Q8ZI62_CURCL|nr:g-protein beta wd-40 repeat-containing protein [Curvularia clavata]